jgi:transcriptional antiterminator RfaH
MSKFLKGWYLIYTRPHHEKKVHAQLVEQDVESFLPLTKKLHTWHDRKKFIDDPLFPSYVFVLLKEMKNYHAGIDADGALYYVRIGKELARVSSQTVDNIRIMVGKGSEIEVSSAPIQPGQSLVIKQGPFAGLSCEMVQYNGSRRILVRVHLLQRNLLMTVPTDQVMLSVA